MTSPSSSYRGYRFPSEIISHAVWLYHRFCLSFREVDEVFVMFHGRRQYLWRAVDQDGDLIDILVQSRRDRHAGRCCTNRHGPARCPPTGSSPADAI